MDTDVLSHNKQAWDRRVELQDRWTVPASPEIIAEAKRGKWEIVLTPSKPVPASWFPPLTRCKVLCLASGGGQQGPVLAAAGADVTVFDNSPKQLEQDRMVAKREGLSLHTVEGDMANLEVFAKETFDLIVHPCSNGFVPKVRPVWKEAFRVLKKGGYLLSGFGNPLVYLFDPQLEKQGIYQLKHSVPYADTQVFPAEELQRMLESGEPLGFGHSLEDQIGGQCDAGFQIVGFYEDTWGGKEPIDRHLPVFIATRALKAQFGPPMRR